MKVYELIEMLEKAAVHVDGDLSEVEVLLHTGIWTTQAVAPLKIEDVGFSFGPDGNTVYIDVLAQQEDFSYLEKGMKSYIENFTDDE